MVLGRLRATRPGEYVVLDTTPLDVFAMEPVTMRWVGVELTEHRRRHREPHDRGHPPDVDPQQRRGDPLHVAVLTVVTHPEHRDEDEAQREAQKLPFVLGEELGGGERAGGGIGDGFQQRQDQQRHGDRHDRVDEGREALRAEHLRARGLGHRARISAAEGGNQGKAARRPCPSVE